VLLYNGIRPKIHGKAARDDIASFQE